MKKTILFLLPYPHGSIASQRLKFEQYFDYFRENGYEITTSSFVDEKLFAVIYKKGFYLQKITGMLRGYLRRTRDLLRLGKYDIVYTHLNVTPIGPSLFENLTRRFSKKLVFDIDDMVYMGKKSSANPLLSWLKGKKKSLTLMKLADHVITCTPDLNDFAKKHCAHCTDISSTLDTDRMKPVNLYTNDKPVTIGWTGTHSTAPYLRLLTPVFQKLAAIRDFRLYVIGNFEYDIKGVNFEYVNWSEKEEIAQLQQIDIGVYPLPSDAWVMGKSGLKALQYMTFGLPTVAANVGNAINRIIENDINGLLVKTPEEWLTALTHLIDHPEDRKRLGLAGRKTVEEHFSIAANRTKYLNILESLTSKK